MMIYDNHSIKIEFLEDSQIMCAKWPETDFFKISVFEQSFFTLMEMIEKYKVKKLVFYANKTIIHLPDEEYKSVVALLQSGFAHSGIEKVARIYVDKSERDLQALSSFKEILNDMQLEIEFKAFDDFFSALTWLKMNSVAVS